MDILIACEESQRVCLEFLKKGHNVYSCDLEYFSGTRPDRHILGDCLSLLNGFCTFVTLDGSFHCLNKKWDMIIAFPPCTYISAAGARWMYANGSINTERYKYMQAAVCLFYSIWHADCSRIAIENPTPLKIANLPTPSAIIQPFEFGEPFSKRTCLWLKGLPPLMPTCLCSAYTPYICSNTSFYAANGFGGSCGFARNQIERSKTFNGIAAAMANQWG